MAKVVREEDVERTLGMAEDQWRSLPEVESEIDGWPQAEQVHFIEEWPLEEVRLERLERYAREGHMTEEQLARYVELKKTVAKNRPLIRALQNS